MTLIVGATGILGGEVCRLLRERSRPVRALVRATSDPEKAARLQTSGCEVVRGDLKDRASLERACAAVDTVVSTASSTLSRQEGDSIESVDRLGQLALIEAAEAAGVRHFVLVSFGSVDLEFPLQSAKRAAEDRLRRSAMTYTILQPSFFTDVWLSPALGFDLGSWDRADLRKRAEQDQLDLRPGCCAVCGRGARQSWRRQQRHQTRWARGSESSGGSAAG